MGGRDIDDIKEVGCKLEIVPCSEKESVVLSHLIWDICKDFEMQETGLNKPFSAKRSIPQVQ